MGNCVEKSSKKSKSEITQLQRHENTRVHPSVRLYGSPTSVLTAYIRFALLYKSVPVDCIVSSDSTARFGGPQSVNETPPSVVLQVGSESISGWSREMFLRFIEGRFPQPPLAAREEDNATPLFVKLTWLQHKSMVWHVGRMVRWVEDLVARGGSKAVDPSLGSPRMEIKKFSKSYSQVLEIMLEHAQMEERVLFPILEKADRGICKAANMEHARDLPMMNGIKEDIKSIGVLDSRISDYQDALSNLSTRLTSLLEQSKEHFEEEEADLLPLMVAIEMSREQEKRTLGQCFDVMQGTHTHLFNFLLEGLLPCDAMQYLDLISMCRSNEQMQSVLRIEVDKI